MLPLNPPAAPLMLTAEDLANLDKARRWARFMAIVGFIGCGLVALLMLLVAMAMTAVPGARGPAAAGLAVFLVSLGVWLVYSGLFLRYALGVAAHARGDGPALARGFSALKLMWIISVVVYALSLLFSIGMSIARLLGLTGV